MAIAVNIYYTGIDGNARRFAQEMVSSGTVEQIRAEMGNLRYDYYFPMDDPETVLLIDEWENQTAIDKHHTSPMMATISSLREKYDLHMKVVRYVSETGDIPAQDKQYIRK
ncbi:MAG: antibiotic biosynthesis monooxygenase [Clostridiales bacterium]|nr:antibiotic biosynthesis monooxygenase [Clostridiales bacterium]